MESSIKAKIHLSVYVFALCLMVVGLSTSKWAMSFSQMLLAFNWFLEGNFKNKFETFINNKPALVISSLMILHFVGLIYTSDFEYAFKDIRIKAPLFIMPVIISTSKPLSQKIINILLKLFVAAVIFSTIISTTILTGIYKIDLYDVRGVSIFISHIRFALMICVSIFISIYFIKESKKLLLKIISLIVLIWLVAFLFIIQSMTGIGVLLVSVVVIGVYYSFKQTNKSYKYLLVSSIFCVCFYFIFQLIQMKNEMFVETKKIDLTNLPLKTKYGHFYYHDVNSVYVENGNLIWVYVCDDELESLWNKRSKIDFNSIDNKGNSLKYVIIRFLASKGLTKDAEGLNVLTREEIKAIEHGITNVKFMNISRFKKRIYETLWEIDLYNKTKDANGHSLTQRFEYWKTALAIIKSNLLFGVGTGDIAKAFEIQYEKSNSLLTKERQLRSHNQFLSIGVAFGLFGVLCFLFVLFYPGIKMRRMSDFLYLSFFIIALLSFITEDTLETQAGVTFFAFMNCFLLFARENNYSINVRS